MNLLLDTHILLWWLDDHQRLTAKQHEAIADPGNLLFLSAAVVWEIRIKQAIGKLKITPDFLDAIKTQGFEMLAVTHEHAYAVGDLPHHHRDPFDRILIAQAMIENFMIITRDAIFRQYSVQIFPHD